MSKWEPEDWILLVFIIVAGLPFLAIVIGVANGSLH